MKLGVFTILSFSVLVFRFLSLNSFSAEATYVKRSELVCDGTRVQIVTKCDDIESEGPPQCGQQTLFFYDRESGHKISAPAYGKPYSKQFEGTGTANGWQCIKGKNQKYITLWYSTGGNCEECEWQAILDLKGNRIITDINKKKRTVFTHKYYSMGLPGLGTYDFSGIPLNK